MTQISKEILNFVEEAKQGFLKDERKVTYRDLKRGLIALRAGMDEDCIQVYELGDEIANFVQWLPRPTKPPSPEFIAKVKEITEPQPLKSITQSITGSLDDGKITASDIETLKKSGVVVVQDPQRAKVGDVISVNLDSLGKQRVEYEWLKGRQLKVKEVKDGKVIVEVIGKVPDMFLEHGYYTIVKRVEDCATYCQSCRQVKKHTHPKDGLFVCEECDPSPEDYECEERAPEPSTSELVEMLAKREAIAFDELVPEDRDAIIQWEKKTNLWSLHTARFKGPARILVIPE